MNVNVKFSSCEKFDRAGIFYALFALLTTFSPKNHPLEGNTAMPNVTVYTKDKCVMCEMTKNELKKKQIPYTEVFITPEVSAELRDKGVKQAPFVIAGEDSWSGFRPDKINSIAA